MPARAWSLFDYLQGDKWSAATNAFALLQARSGRSGAPVPRSQLQAAIDILNQGGKAVGLGLPPPKASALQHEPWHAIVDAHWAYVLSKTWPRESLDLITASIQSIVPPGAILFGDSDPGRFAVARAMESQVPEKRFWVITQNQLADYSYWDYARFVSRRNITMPSVNDFDSAYSRYLAGSYGTGGVAVAAMNAEFSQKIFRDNSERRIYIEASWFLPAWAYECALPQGPVFELSRQRVSRLEDTMLKTDREFWSDVCKKLLGDVIKRETTVGEVCDFVEAIYVRNDLSAFKGERNYISDGLVQEWFGMARRPGAALYQWRCIQSERSDEKQRMLDEAIFAYKQTLALSPMTSMDFSGLLSQIGRTNEAARILAVRDKTAARTKATPK